jgi:deoxyribodipyrimidine photo-lyase
VLPEATIEPALMAQADPLAPLPPPPPTAAMFAGRDLWLVHPWALRAAPGDLPVGALRVGLWLTDFHARWPWSAARWRFVSTGMAALTEGQCRGDIAAWRHALAAARSVRGWRDAHLGAALDGFGLEAPAALFAEPASRCASFSRYWDRVTRGRVQAAELLGAADR